MIHRTNYHNSPISSGGMGNANRKKVQPLIILNQSPEQIVAKMNHVIAVHRFQK